jgi:hypothetical protein
MIKEREKQFENDRELIQDLKNDDCWVHVVYSESSWTRVIKSVFYILSGTSFLSPSKYSPSDAMHLSTSVSIG